MQTVADALTVIGNGVGSRLTPDGDGFVKLRLEDALDVFLEIVSETELEVTVRLTDGKAPLETDLLEGCLRANADPNKPRLSIESGSNALMLGDRIDVLAETESSIAQRLSDITLTALRFIRGGLGPMRALAAQGSDASFGDLSGHIVFRL